MEPLNLERIDQRNVELTILVPTLNRDELIRLFERIESCEIRTPMLLVLPFDASEELLKSAIKAVDDFMLSPVRDEELTCRVARILGAVSAIKGRLKRRMALDQLVGKDPKFVASIDRIPSFAASRAPVLVLGETGTGKELCAHAIHSLSARCAGPFVPVDCGTLPEQLIENELFGHARGAFTDAHSDQRGLAALAEGGTLFLDEIDSLAITAQSKLLRFIAERTYRPLGSQRQASADVRLIAATNCDLEESVRRGEFRQDLYFRLNVLPLRLPPLRERRGDIGLLANHFMQSTEGAGGGRISASALRVMEAHDWPGNVRELFNVIQRAVAFSGGSAIMPEHLGLNVHTSEGDAADNDFRGGRRLAIERFEKHFIETMLSKHSGNVTRAAMEAQKDRRVFGRLMKKYRIGLRGAQTLASHSRVGSGSI